jgi:hypothetical protein
VLRGNVVGVTVPAATTLDITNQPQSVQTYVAQPVLFFVGASSDGILPPTFQWRRNGTNIPDATYRSFGFVADPADDGDQFDCIVQSPGVSSLTKTSQVATVTVQAGATFSAGALLLERWTTGAPNIPQIKLGGAGSPDLLTTIDAADTPDLGIDNYGQRMTGLFIPPTSGAYVFFVSSDDETEVFLGTTDLPSSKLLICQEPNWSPNRYSWLTSSGGGLVSQKRSDQWSPNPGVIDPPYSNGIPLVAGTRYYFETVFHEGGGGDWTGVYYKLLADPDPVDGTPANVTSGVIGRMVAPVVSQPVLTVTRSGNNLNVSWTPAGGTLQSTTALPGGWGNVGTANPAVVPIGTGNLFLRVEQ